jgi:hypothetical protein
VVVVEDEDGEERIAVVRKSPPRNDNNFLPPPSQPDEEWSGDISAEEDDERARNSQLKVLRAFYEVQQQEVDEARRTLEDKQRKLANTLQRIRENEEILERINRKRLNRAKRLGM